MESLRKKLLSGGVSCGPFLKLTDPAVAEIVGLAGFTHAVIDLEHGPLTIQRAQDLIRAARLRGLAPMVRVGANRETEILRALDIGAEGVHIPHIDSREEAQRALSACYFHPSGSRGVCRYVRAADYTATPKATHFREANERIVPVLHIEGQEGVRALPDILELEGHGIIFLGPYDLSQSCGVPGEVNHPKVLDAMRSAVAQAKQQGVAVGTFVDAPEDAGTWAALGVQYICLSVDVGILYDACAAASAALKAEIEKSGAGDRSRPT